ncbi:hypothetical protein [Kordia zhangzhouensis]|uniref:hypothetical protein n=1 Tax=Kordia zhangzhouensis TaxID=1620405 RepID=UPI0012E0B958|nr:hypothetical protein [Kordia zhangzhouensis]
MFIRTFSTLSVTAEKRLFVLTIASFLLAASCMIHFDEPLKSEITPLGIVSFELAKTPEKALQILTLWQTTENAILSAEWSLWFDYIFIITYALLLSLIIGHTQKKCWKSQDGLGFRLGTIMIRMVILAAFLDMVENAALLLLYYGDVKSLWTHLAFAAATIKFIHLMLAIIYIIVSWLVIGFKKTIYVKK